MFINIVILSSLYPGCRKRKVINNLAGKRRQKNRMSYDTERVPQR
jgi:hypothetical protein